MPLELFADNAATTLTSSPSSAATSFTVASSTGFPAAVTGVSQFRVIIGTEIVTVTNVSGTTWTCVATSAAHTSADLVTHVLTAASLGNFVTGNAGILASVKYDPSTWTQKTIATATMTALDATNLAVTFNAPGSGVVLVRLSAEAGAGAVVNGYWGLLNASGGAEVARASTGAYTAASVGDLQTCVALKVTGLTPGTAYTYQFAHCTNASGGTFRTTYGDGPGGNPAVMEVLAA